MQAPLNFFLNGFGSGKKKEKACEKILISDKVDFKPKTLTMTKENYFIMKCLHNEYTAIKRHIK